VILSDRNASPYDIPLSSGAGCVETNDDRPTLKWFEMSVTCVRWHGHDSEFLRLIAGVRQGGVLSQCLFAIFVDDIKID